MLAHDDRDAFLRIVGPGGLLLESRDLLPYETAARYGGGKAAAVVRPSDTAEVSGVMAHCVRRGLAFLPQSGNTGLVLGSTPDESGREIVISLDRLRAPLRLDPTNRSVTAAGGVRLSALNAELEPHGLFLPIDLSSDPMIGGMVATNAGGARFLRYGDMRRHVLGLEVVLPDDTGTVLKLAGGLRKNNSQLDLRQIFIGSCGAFGIITAATLEVHPRPRQSAAALLVPRDEDAVLEILTAFEGAAGDHLSAFEGMSESAMRHAFTQVAALRNPFPEGLPAYAVLVELSSAAPAGPEDNTMDALLETVVAGLAERRDTPITDARFGAPQGFWALRHSLSAALKAAGPVVGFDLSFRRGDVWEFRRIAVARIAAEFPEFEVCDYGHVADGGVHFNLLQRSRTPPGAERLAALRDRVLAIAVEDFGASFSGEHGIGRANQDAYDRFTPPLQKRYSAAVAAVFARVPAAAVRFGPP